MPSGASGKAFVSGYSKPMLTPPVWNALTKATVSKSDFAAAHLHRILTTVPEFSET